MVKRFDFAWDIDMAIVRHGSLSGSVRAHVWLDSDFDCGGGKLLALCIFPGPSLATPANYYVHLELPT